MDIRVVSERSAVPTVLSTVDAPVVGVDVERADGHRYHREAALVQVGVGDRCAVLDPIALDQDLAELGAFLVARSAILHALENDLEPLAAAGVDVVGEGPPHARVADTATAAGLLGLPTGLGPLLTEVLGVELSDDKERFQRADWSARPIDADMLAYAAGDVVHLPELWADLERRLLAAGRHEWYRQELAATIEHARTATRSWTRVRGAGRLDGHGRAVLRAVWEEREDIARTEDVAPQRVARDEVLVAAAAQPPSTINVLARHGLRRRQLRDYGDRLLAAVRRGASAPDEPALGGRRRSTEDDRAAVDRMRAARAEVARELGIDAGVLCPGRVLAPAVLAGPATPDELCEAALLRPWQRELLADVLWAAYRGEDA